MKKTYCLLSMAVMLLFVKTSFSQNRYWISVTSSNWNNTANWSVASGGAGGASVPGVAEVAIFNGAGGKNGACNLDISPTVAGLTVNGYSGIIDLSGNNLTTTGTNTFTSGTINNSGAAASLTLNTAGTSTFNGTTFNASITGSSGRISFNGSVFNNSVSVTKTNNTTDNCTGGNTFNSTVSLTNSSTSALQLASTNPDIFQGQLTLTINNTGDLSLGRTALANQFNNNIIINYNALGNVLFGANNGTSTLASGKTISIGTVGASGCGNLQLSNFTQIGATSQTITLSGNDTALLTFGPATTFNGQLTATTPDLGLQTATFNGTTSITKTGSTTANLRGGNTFAGTTTINNQGGDLVFGSIITDPGDTFNGASTFNNTGGNRIRVSEESAGTIFNGVATFNCLSVTDVNNRIQISRLAGGQTTFNNAVFFISNGAASDIQVSYDAGTSTTFNGPVSFTSNAIGGGDFFIGVDGDVIFNNNIEFNSLCTDPIFINNGVGTVTLGTGAMSIGASGFAQGEIRFKNFTQTGATAQALTLTGTGILRFYSPTTFAGAVNFVAPQVYLNGATFNGTTYIEKTGATDNAGNGNNVFNTTTSLVNSGSGYLLSGNTNLDTFNGQLTLTNTGTNTIYMAHAVPGTVFNQNVIVNSTGGSGIFFCNNAGGTASLANGKTITVGATGFTAGALRLQRFTQTGTTAQNLTFTGTGLLRLGPSSTFNGNVNFVAPQAQLNGVTCNGTAYIEKNGATDNTGTGGDVFNGVTTLVNSGSGSFELADTSPDVFSTTLTVNNTGTNRIQIGISSAGNTFNGNVTINHGGNNTINTNTIIARNAGCTATFNGSLTLNCTNVGGTGTGLIIANDGAVTINGNVIVSSTNGRGILFGSGLGTAILSNGFTIKDGGAGTFTKGTLTLKGFTQAGATAQSFTLTGTSDLTIGPASIFNAALTTVSPQLYLNGGTFQGTTYLEKSGATDNAGNGNNVFNGTTTLVNSGSGYLLSANTTLDIFNGPLTLTNTGSNTIYMAHNVPGTVFNENVVVNSTAGNGVYFCNNSTGTASLANGKTITVGVTGFTTGELRLKRFTQVGATAQSLTLTGTAAIRVGPSTTFNGVINFLAPRMFLDGATFNAAATIEKNGATGDDSAGGNIFNSTATITCSAPNRFRLATVSADAFNGNVFFTRSGASNLDVAYTSTNTFSGDININTAATAGITFGGGGGTVQLNGTGAQAINKTGSANPSMVNLTLAKASGAATINSNLTITGAATFSSGILNSTSSSTLIFADNATVSSTSNTSFVNGPVRKVGNDAFIFPVGKGSAYRPITMSAPGVTTDQFTAQYFNSAQGYGGKSTWGPGIYSISTCDYWILDRTAGTSNVTVKLFWDIASCSLYSITNLADLRVARFNTGTSQWLNEGNGGTTGTASSGTVITTAAVTTFSPFALATFSNQNILPIELGAFWSRTDDQSVQLKWTTLSEKNNEKFIVQRSGTGFDFVDIGIKSGAGNSIQTLNYSFTDGEPLTGTSYYRLKQIDFDGKETLSHTISVHFKGKDQPFEIYPNPIHHGPLNFNQKVSVVIINSLNQVVLSANEVESLDVTSLASGVYFIKNQKGQIAKFVKE